MSRRFSISEARKKLPTLVRDVEQGPPVELTRRGKPVAVLVSVHSYARLSEGKMDLWTAIEDFRHTHELKELDPDEIYAGTRDRTSGREVDL